MNANEIQQQNIERLRTMLDGRVGEFLRAARMDAHMSQPTLAKLLGWTRNMVANLETGRRVARVEDFVLVAHALNIKPEKLLRRMLQW